MSYDEATFRRKPDQPTETDPAAYRRRVQYDDTAAGTLDQSLRAPVHTTGSIPVVVEDDGRDRLGVHLGWEVLLLLAAGAIGFLLFSFDADALRRPDLDALLVSGAAIGLLTLGAGLSLRAGVPNLAIGPVALAAAFQYAENSDRGLIPAIAPALVIAAAGGLLVAIFVLALHVPGWATTLAAGLGVIVYSQLRVAPVAVQGDWAPTDQAFLLFGGFALLALLGGGLGAIGPVRRWVGGFRPAGDPSRRPGPAAAVAVVLALVLSSVFAAGAGILLAANASGPVQPGTGLEWTGIGIGLALLGGTSAYGRRGGIFGTLFAVTAMALFLDYENRRELDIAIFAVAASVFAAGLIVTRLVETYGRPLPAGTGEEWNAAASNGTWSPAMPETWNSPGAAPAARGERWDEGPWSANR
ncbi:ABC transporter permease [Actinoplanes sp. DH11]|uniref:ABC transporter permease n=1 Tax=Actinoplanes sp. DH11 TaxID=2857011 RepID=UPI001E4F0530|nr:ABC transporter permease [Actinoplanes sp. DH11]